MRQLALASSILLLAMWSAPTAAAHVSLLYPAGGEALVPGSTVTITWQIDIPHDQLDWDLYFSPDGGATWQVIGANLPVTQLSYEWTVPAAMTMQGRIRIVQDNNGLDYEDQSSDFDVVAVSTEIDPDVPMAHPFVDAYPNPFTTAATLEVVLAREDHVVLEVFDLLGRRVALLADEVLPPGTHPFRWTPPGASSGVYLFRLRGRDFTEVKTLLRAN